MTKLSVNINKIATLRNARGGNVPDLLKTAKDIESFGADGITVHPRPDQRHIRYTDVLELSSALTKEFNIEGYPSKEFLDLISKVKPTQVTLVPDMPDALTSNAGWDVKRHFSMLQEVVSELKNIGPRISLFMEADLEQITWAQKLLVDRIELYTEPYAKHYSTDKEQAIKPFIRAAEFARSIGFELNAGHDLSLQNLSYLKHHIPYLQEVSIGHALISDALYLGMHNTIQLYQQQLKTYYTA